MALDQSELSPGKLAVCFTDETRYFVSEPTVKVVAEEGLEPPTPGL